MGIHKRKEGAVDKWRETQGRAGTRLKAAPQGQTVNRSLIKMKPDSPSAMKVSALLSEQAQSPTGLNPAVETVAHLARQVKGSPNLEG